MTKCDGCHNVCVMFHLCGNVAQLFAKLDYTVMQVADSVLRSVIKSSQIVNQREVFSSKIR